MMARPLNVCCVATQTEMHLLGGMALHTSQLATDLARLGHAVTMVTTSRVDGVREASVDGVDHHYLAGTVPGAQTRAWWPASVAAFARLHAATPFDVVWSQSVAAAALARSGPRGGPPLVAVIHGTSPEMITSIIRAVRHASARAPMSRTLRRLVRQLVNYVAVDPVVYRRAARILPVSATVARSVRRWYRIDPARIAVVPNGVDVDRFQPDADRRATVRARWGVRDGDRVLLTVGILSDQKGVDVAIEALARVRPRDARLRLLVVGDGPSRPALERLARARGVAEAVTFVGRVPHVDTAGFYDAADVFVFPTLRDEAFGVVTIEAMATERPVIVSRVGATPEIVDDGVTGFLVPPGHVDAVADRIARLTADPVRARTMGQRGRARVVAEWTRAARARQVAEHFDAVRAR